MNNDLKHLRHDTEVMVKTLSEEIRDLKNEVDTLSKWVKEMYPVFNEMRHQ